MTDEQRLRDGLHRLADDRPLTLPDVVGRAKAARTRRWVGATSVAVVAVVACVATVAALTSGRTATPVPAEPTPAPSPVGEALTADDVTLRCADQLAAYDALPRWAGLPRDGWRPADVSYRVGDVAAFVLDEGPGVKFCLVPEEGERIDVVKSLVPSLDDPGLVTRWCAAALYGRVPPQGRGEVADLRDARIATSAEAVGYVTVTIARGNDTFACDLAPLTSAAGGPSALGPLSPPYDRLPIDPPSLTVGQTGASGPGAAVVAGSGMLSLDATSIRLSGNATATVPVVSGRYSLAVGVPSLTGDELGIHVEVLGADGSVLATVDI